MAESGYSDRNVPVASNAAGPPALHSERMLIVRELSPATNLRDYLSIFFKHRKTIIVVFLVLSVLGCTLAAFYNKVIYAPRFEAKSSILIKFGWENYYPDPSLGKRDAPAVNQDAMLGAEMSILNSRDLKRKVISSLTPQVIFPSLTSWKMSGLSKQDEALLLLDKFLEVQVAKGNVVDVVFDGSNPLSAAEVVNQLVSAYIEKRSEIYKDPKSALFLQNKVDFYRQKLSESQTDLKAFSQRTKIIAFDQQRKILVARRATLTSTLSNTVDGIKEEQQILAELEKELKAIPKSELTAAASDRAGDAQSRLLGLRLQEQQLVAKYKGNNPLISAVRDQIATVEGYIKKYSAENPNVAPADPVYQGLQRQIFDHRARLSALTARYTGTQNQLVAINKEIDFFESNENQYSSLGAALSSNKRIYDDYRAKLEEANVYNELGRDKMTSVSVIEPATAPVSPVNPPKPLLLLFGAAIAVAFFGSLGIAYILEVNKQGMSTPMEVEKRVDLPVLITIPVKE